MSPPTPLSVEVPGSTSNLGPGFDLLGLAVSLPLRARVAGPSGSPAHVLRTADAARETPQEPSRNALVAALEAARGGGEGLLLEIDSEIPVGRGFGSSGAAVAAGLLLGNALAARPSTRAELLARGIALEGHPDNVTASLFGGCTLCHPDAGPGGRPLLVRQPLAEGLGLAAAWPDVALPTGEARAALPERVAFADARENPRRLALLLEGLRTASPELLAAGAEDRLHVPHRLHLIPGAEEALAAARREGAWLATLSGAGSGLFALGAEADAEAIAEAMAAALRVAGGSGTARVLRPVLDAPRVVEEA